MRYDKKNEKGIEEAIREESKLSFEIFELILKISKEHYKGYKKHLDLKLFLEFQSLGDAAQHLRKLLKEYEARWEKYALQQDTVLARGIVNDKG